MNGLGRKKQKKDDAPIFTRETLGVVLILFATLCLVCLITRDAVFSVPGKYVNAFLFGCFGYFAYAVDIFVILLGVLLVFDKKTGISAKRKTLVTLFFFLAAVITHVITMHGKDLAFKDYLLASYNMADGGIKTASGGGIVTALAAWPVSTLLTEVGSYVICGICVALTVYFFVRDFAQSNASQKEKPVKKFNGSYQNEKKPVVEVDNPQGETADSDASSKRGLFVNNPNSFAFKNKRELNKDSHTSGLKLGYAEGGLGVVSSPNAKSGFSTNADYEQKLDYIKTPATLNVETVKNNGIPVEKPYYTKPEPVEKPYESGTRVSDYINTREVKQTPPENESEIPFIEHDTGVTVSGDSVLERSRNYDRLYTQNPEVKQTESAPEEDVVYRAVREGRIEEIKDTESSPIEDIPFVEETLGQVDTTAQEPVVEDLPAQSPISTDRRVRDIFGVENKDTQQEKTASEDILGFTSRVSADNNLPSRRLETERASSITSSEPEKPKKVQPPINRKYHRPPFDLLERYIPPVDAPQENHQERMEIIQRTLEEFHINAIPQSYVQGPSFTRYEVMMPAGVSVRKVLGYDDDLKMRLAAKDGVRIEAPIPGKNLVGVEVANTTKSTVGFREVMEGIAKNPPKGALTFAVGKDIVGNSISYDLAKGPHYLIAGATGSGKSVCLHVMILSLLMRYSPEEMKVVLVDPKSVEFRKYEHIPHLLVDEIITEPKRVLALLKWAYEETTRRNDMFTAAGAEISNIDDYNKYVASDTVPKLPRIVFFMDELADLMEACKKDLEQRIRMIAAKSRSAGIHLVLATQRPSVDVITGTIKANLPSRIALKVMNYADSSTILGEGGAEKLLGNGDMLFKDSSMGNYERYQGAYISGREISSIVNYIKEHNKAYFDDELVEFLDNETRPKQEEPVSDSGEGGGNPNEIDDFFLKALWLAVNTQTVSISQLQRRFQIGYSRAGGLVDKMERMGFVSPNEGSKARRVLLSREQFEEKFGTMNE